MVAPDKCASGLSRRAVIVGAGAAACAVVTGCHSGSGTRSGATSAATPGGQDTPAPTAPPDSDAIEAARAAESQLLKEYDAVIARTDIRQRPQLVAARAVHATHLEALGVHPTRLVQSSPVVGVPLSRRQRRRRTRRLAEQETRSGTTLRRAATAAQVGSTAALLASIGAAHTAAAESAARSATGVG